MAKKTDIDKNNINRLYDLFYGAMDNIRDIVDGIIRNMGVMKKSDYDTNDDGKVDISESVALKQKPQSVTETDIKFGVDANGKWGYIKGGADTVIPFKGDATLQSKTVSPTTSQQVVTPDSGYDGLEQVTINAANLQARTATPSLSQQVITPQTFPGSTYIGLSQVTVEAITNKGTLDTSFAARSDVTYNTNGTYTMNARVISGSGSGIEGYYEGYRISDPQFTITVAVPSATLQSNKTVSPTTSQQVVTPDSGYDGLEQVTVNAVSLQSKTATPSSSQQVITPGSGYIGLSQVIVNAVSLQSKTATPSTSQQVITPDSGYTALSQVTISAISLQSKSVSGMTPSANWSGAYTNAYTISPDSGYDGMSSVSVTVPMVRDYSLFTVSTVETPSTVYNGDTAQSNSTKMLRIAPTKTGMVYTNSYLELGPSSYMGNATAADVLSGKTFSSANGIQLTGTNSGGITPTGNINLGTFTTNGSKTGFDVSSYATCSFNIQVSAGGNIQSRKDAGLVRYDSTMNVQPDTGYDGIRYVGIPSLKNCMVNLWSNSSSSSAFSGQTITLSQAWNLFAAIIIYYRPHKDNTSTYYYSMLLEYNTINAHNNTSTNKFALCGRASTSASATSGSMYERAFRFASTTTITFGGGTQAGGTSTSNNVMIPVAVYGIY